MGTDHTYSYPRPSAFSLERGLELETSGGTAPDPATGPVANPRLFRGSLGPAAAAGLLAVSNVARARYLNPSGGGYRDPILTCDGKRLRVEAFSDCGGMHVRLDVLPEGMDGEVLDHGTTNVDVNDALRRALATITDRRVLRVAVGRGEAPAGRAGRAGPERAEGHAGRTVPLPEQWLRGFAEVQAVSSGLEPRARLGAAQAARFLHAPPGRSRTGGPLWLMPADGTLRPVPGPCPGAVCLSGAQRLAALRPVLRMVTGLRVYGPAVTAGSPPAPSGWEFDLPGMRLTAVLSPELVGGFPAPAGGPPGEGGAILPSAEAAGVLDDADVLGATLELQSRLDVDLLAARTGLDARRVRRALVQLARSGRVGHDLAEALYFHRELPYDLDTVELLNPRLAGARALVDAGAVHVERRGPDDVDVLVTVNGGQRPVRLHQGRGSCSCPWYERFEDRRGTCLHVLAAQLAVRPGRRRTAPDAAPAASAASTSPAAPAARTA